MEVIMCYCQLGGFLNFKYHLYRLLKWWEFHVCCFFCDVYIRDIHGEACIVGHVTTLGCRTNTGQFVFMIVIIKWYNGGILPQNDLHFIFHWWFLMNLCTSVCQSIQDTKCYTNFSSCSDIFPLVRLILSHFLPVFSQQIQGFGSEIATVALFGWLCSFCLRNEAATKTSKSKMVQFYLCSMVTVTSKKVAF